MDITFRNAKEFWENQIKVIKWQNLDCTQRRFFLVDILYFELLPRVTRINANKCKSTNLRLAIQEKFWLIEFSFIITTHISKYHTKKFVWARSFYLILSCILSWYCAVWLSFVSLQNSLAGKNRSEEIVRKHLISFFDNKNTTW